jgi:ATP synthase protein I
MADEDKKSEKPGKYGELVKVELMAQLALALPIGCVLGWLGGSWLDRHFGTTSHWMGITGILLGAAGGFLQIYRTASRFLGNK